RRRRRGCGLEAQAMNSVIALSAIALADFALITLRQLGIIKHLPDPPGRWFDSDKINTSKAAHPFGIPDGALGAAGYAANIALAATGRRRLLKVATVAQALAAAYYLREMLFRQKKLCPYCLVGIGI